MTWESKFRKNTEILKGIYEIFFFFEQESIKVVINRIDSFSAFKSQK